MLLSVGFATQAACSSRKNGTHYSHLRQRKNVLSASRVTDKPQEEFACLSQGLTPLPLHTHANTYKVIHWPRKRAEIPQQPKSQLWLQTKDATKLCSVLPFKSLFLSMSSLVIESVCIQVSWSHSAEVFSCCIIFQLIVHFRLEDCTT